MVEIQKVDLGNKAQVKEFIDFHYQLYENCPQWVPPFKTDIRTMMNPNKHPFYEHSEAEFFIARRGNEIVGRIGALVNKPFNQYHQSKKAQFYLFDCIDDQESADALFNATAEWAKKRGLDTLVGPKGFGPLDGYGIQVEGFEYRQMMNMMNYNYPYYLGLFEKAGFHKANEFVSCYVDPVKFHLPEKPAAVAKRVLERGTLQVKRFKNKRELISWANRIGQAYNKAFVQNWEYWPLSENEIKFVVDNIMVIADPRLMKIVVHRDDVVGFLFVFPDISEAMKRQKGNLTPLEILDLMRETKRTKWVSLNGVGMLPEWQGRGGNALMYYEIEKSIREAGFTDAEQTQMADTAEQVRKDMITLGAVIYKRHRVMEKNL